MVKLTVDKYLDSHGITQYELAKRAGISYESGK